MLMIFSLNWNIRNCLEQKRNTINSPKKTPSYLPNAYREVDIGQVSMTLKHLTSMRNVCDSILSLNTGQSDYSVIFVSSYSKFMNCVQISALQFPSKSFPSNNSPSTLTSTMYIIRQWQPPNVSHEIILMGYSCRNVRLATDLHVVQTLGMSNALCM
jgi:hypothetical protein